MSGSAVRAVEIEREMRGADARVQRDGNGGGLREASRCLESRECGNARRRGARQCAQRCSRVVVA